MTHRIKLLEKYADDVFDGTKPFEIRKNDRGYKVGDTVSFLPVNANGDSVKHPINDAFFVISYLLKGPLYGLEEGYVVFALEKLTLESALILETRSFIVGALQRAKKQQGENFTFVLNMDDWGARNLFVISYQDDQPIEAAWKEELRYLSTSYNITRCGERKWLISNRERENKGDENGIKNEQT